MALKPAPVAKALNDRQRHYLLAAYKLDQETEQQRRRDFARGLVDDARTPAAEWRAMPYGRWEHRVLEGKPPTPLRQLLDPTLMSPGTGSTWKALAERGLLTVEDRLIRFPFMNAREVYELPHVSLTRAGRKLARELLGEVRPPRPKKLPPPEGILPYGYWLSLSKLYVRDGKPLEAARLPTPSVAQLVQRGLIAGLPADTMPPAHYCLTEAGRAYYHRYFHVNHAAYPQVSAEWPRPLLTPAHRAFWDKLDDLAQQRRGSIGPTAACQRAVLATQRAALRLKLAEGLGAAYVEPYWYPTLAGIVQATSGGRSGVALQLETEQEALEEGRRRQQLWQNELNLVFDYE